MFGIGMPELLLILAVALIVIGPKKLPDLARSLGKAMGEFKKATSELKESIQIDSEIKSVKTSFDDIERDLKQAPPEAADKPAAETGAAVASDPIEPVRAAFHRDDADRTAAPQETGTPASGNAVDDDASAEDKPSRGAPT